jgi:hypothetical protein
MPPVQTWRHDAPTKCEQCDRLVRNVLIIYGGEFICLHCAKTLCKAIGAQIGFRIGRSL